jgi:hypothetical protein
LKADFRGLIVTMIHKFEAADKNLSTCNVYCLIDERTGPPAATSARSTMAALPRPRSSASPARR